MMYVRKLEKTTASSTTTWIKLKITTTTRRGPFLPGISGPSFFCAKHKKKRALPASCQKRPSEEGKNILKKPARFTSSIRHFVTSSILGHRRWTTAAHPLSVCHFLDHRSLDEGGCQSVNFKSLITVPASVSTFKMYMPTAPASVNELRPSTDKRAE